jgi:predicted N-acetyltransferase YhbS
LAGIIVEVIKMGGIKQMLKIDIRPLLPGDIGRIIDIDEKLTGEQRTANQAEIMVSDIGGDYDLSIVAEVDGIVAGFIVARQVFLGEPITDTAAINYMGVDPEYSRRGIATKLVNALMEKSKAKGIKTVRVPMGDKDSKLEAFFKHLGFVPARIKVYGKCI